ncbi:MAG: peptide chain release factor N(5)-glutamine methyltransferase [Candidatus Omnitrophica bacterium]|nr:peptide chain release factor N(5)-glutamine methyltransferase [Candidatus Omnitrophota bacterium]
MITEYSETVPVQYEEGKASFMGMDIKVDSRVFIPRPETELLVEKTAYFLKAAGKTGPSVLDLCTGSGVIALALSKLVENVKVTASDISEDALVVARDNFLTHNGKADVTFIVSDMFSAFGEGGIFDCIVSNPPYVSRRDYEKLDPWVKAEPKQALYSGDEGLDHLAALTEHGLKYLSDGGFMAVEIGYDQAEKVKGMFKTAGFKNITSFEDFNKFERVIIGWKNG